LSTTIQNALSFATIGIFLFFVIVGSSRASIHNVRPLFADGDTFHGALRSTLRVLQVVPYFLAGFEAVSRFSEERSSGFQVRHFTRVILTALWAGVIFYAATIAIVALLVPWQDLTTSSLVTLIAFHRAFDSQALVNLILVAAIISLIKVYNSCMLSTSRLIFSLGRIGLVHKAMADVDRDFLVPAKAIVLVSILAALGCCLGKAILVPISDVGSFCFTVGWFLTSASYLLKPGDRVGSGLILGTLGVTVTGTLILLKLLPVMPDSFRFWEYCSLSIWALLGWLVWATRDRQADGRLSRDP
jgi:L-asparagine transporter-like permease